MRTVSGQFSIGSTVVRLTIPTLLYGGYLFVFPEISNDEPAGRPRRVFLQAANNRVAVERGTAIHLEASGAERLFFALTDEQGSKLCTWSPPVTVSRYNPPQVADGFRKFNFHLRRVPSGNAEGLFTTAGDPLLLEMAETLATGHSEFLIDGVPATVLARTSWQVILRDSEPKTGLRTIVSAGYEITLPFIRVETELLSLGRRDVAIRFQVSGADVSAQPGGVRWTQPSLLVWNLSQDKIKLLCGTSYRRDADGEDMHSIHLILGRNDVLSGTCKARRIDQGEIHLDFQLAFDDRTRRLPELLPRLPLFPFRPM